MNILKFCLLFLLLRFVSTNTLEGCDYPLEMQSEEIFDENMTTIASLNKQEAGPQNSSLESILNSVIWCPAYYTRNYSTDRIQVNLTTIKRITAVATQGQLVSGDVSKYKLMYARPGSSVWETFVDQNGNQILDGDNDTARMKKHIFDPPVRASAVQFVPTGELDNIICMRVQLFGCNNTDGVIRTIPELNMTDALRKNLMWIIFSSVVAVVCLSVICISFYNHRKGRNEPPEDTSRKVTYVRRDWPELQAKTVVRVPSSQAHVVEPLIEHKRNPVYGIPVTSY